MHKKALKKCMGMPAPELELHKLMEPYKLIQSMLRGMKEHQSDHMMKMVTMMKAKAQQMNHGVVQQQQPITMAYVPYPMMQANQQSGMDDETSMMMKMMKKMMMKKFLRKMMHGMGPMSHDEEEEEEDDVKMVDSNMNLDKNLLMADLDNYKWDDQWLLQKSKDDTNKCFAVAQSIPKFVAEDFYSEKWGRIKMFHFCMKKHQAYTCMKYDVKKMLEKHFGQLGDLVEQTDIEENMLLDLVHGILEDSMGH